MIDPPGHTDHARLLPALLRPCCSVLPVALLIGMLSLLVLPAAGQTTITVNSTADTAVPLDAHCTLREALTNANANTDTTANDCAAGTSTGIDTIVFNFVFGGPPRIKPGSALPVITDPVVIDGETFGDADCGSSIASRTLTVELDGSSSSGGSGLVLGSGSDGSTIRGLVIRQWPSSGVRISGSHNNTVACNFIGTDVTGTADLGNNLGVFIFDGATGNTIGGTTAGAGNLISGNNTEGVAISDSDNNTVAGNFIGTDATGSADLGNTYRGVSIGNGATSNTIGGTAAGARNVISGNSYGVHFEFSGNNNTVAGNFIGTDATGSADLGNTFNGVLIDHSTGNTIGGTTAGAGNVISGNNSSGVFIDDSDNNTVAGNFIGTDATGSADLGNSGTGVRLSFGTGNTIGGTAVGAGNVISGNNGHGVVIEDSDNNTVAGNFIGTDVTGTADLGNSKRGVYIDSGSGNTIGGEAAGAGNVISGNNSSGVGIDDSDNNTVAGNLIGTDVTGSADLRNNGRGVIISTGASNNTIGGTAAGAGNTVAFNSDGIVLDPSVGTGNAIARNSLFENVQIGIDLGDDGLTPNDAGDGDTGPNRLQNTPILTAIIHSGNLLLTYSVDSDLTNATYPLTVEVFEADTDGEEGKTFLGSDTYTTTDRSVCGTPPCAKTVNLGAAGALEVLPGHALVTTATDGAGNTSEFSLSAFVYATRYVATTGNDTGNDCTNPGTPCATLAHAVSQANAGDTIDLEMGTYNASSVVIDKAVHILGAGVVVQ